MEEYRPTDLARWLRQRRKRRSADGPIQYGDPDFYDEYGFPYDTTPPASLPIIVGLVAIAVLVGIWLLLQNGGGSTTTPPVTGAVTTGATTSQAPATTTAGASTTGAGATTSAPTTSQAPQAGPTGFEPIDRVLRGPLPGGVVDPLQITTDAVEDWIDSISDVIAAYQGGEIDIETAVAWLMQISEEAGLRLFNESEFECGQTDPLVACADEVLDVPAGEVLVVAVEHAAAIPLESAERSYIYSLVFDSDGDPANDWVFQEPFDFDYFGGTDRWYQLIYDHRIGLWVVDVVQLEPGPAFPAGASPSAVRALVHGEWVVWFVPVAELPGYPVEYRVTAFAHDGAFGQDTRGGDVLGEDPTGPMPIAPEQVAVEIDG